MRLFWLLPLGLIACDPSKVTVDGEPGETGDSSAVTVDVDVSDLTWRLHADIESMVYAAWTQSSAATVHVEYSFDDGIWASSPSFEAAEGTNEQLLVGIPFATVAAWRVVVEGSVEQGASVDGPPITTGPLPDGLPIGEVTVSEPDLWLPGGNYLLTSINERGGGWTSGKYWTFILDRQARVVWAHAAPERHWTLFATVARTKDYFMWDEATYWSDGDGGAASTIHKTYLDEEIEEVPTPGLHHTFLQLPDLTLVWGSQDHGGGEALVERRVGEEGETILWTCDDDWPGAGRCESNGLFYNEAADTFLYSFYTNNSIVEVDHTTGESLWWAGDVRGGYAFDPPSSQYAWQHGISYTDTGSLLVSSEYDPDGDGRDGTFLLEYTVDTKARTLHEIWENDSNSFASTNGDAWRLSNGNTLHIVGAAGVAREVAPDGNDVWRIDYHDDKLLGRGELLTDLYTLVKPRPTP